MRRRLNIRWKLTLWYGGVLALVLTVFSGVAYLVMRQQLMARIDQGLHEEIADVLSEVQRAQDGPGLRHWLDRRFSQHEGFDFQIAQADGTEFFVSQRLRLSGRRLPPAPSQHDEVRTVDAGASRSRIISRSTSGPEGPLAVQVARSLAAFDQEAGALLSTFLLVGPLTLAAAMAGGYLLARRALAPVDRMTRAAQQISADRLSERLVVDNPGDELGALGQTLNQMIERLERSFAQMQRFTADAAHELRTPLAVMRSEAEVALRAPRSAADYAHALENLLEETNRLAALADQLLFLCRHDAGLQPGQRETLALDVLVKEVVANMQLVAEAKGISLVMPEPGRLDVLADAGQLRRVFYNLLDNAIKYTPPGGNVTVAIQANNGRIVGTIQDTGIGVAAENLPRLFDRFYQVDAVRGGENGAGLGLSLCQSIVKGLGGSISLESTEGKGTTVFLSLPGVSHSS